MPKKILILVVSSLDPPYDTMLQTSLNTWDSVQVANVETFYYCGFPTVKQHHEMPSDKIILFPYKESYANMGYKLLDAFGWALKQKEFDYIARVNSSCYVDKKRLVEYVETLPNEKVFAGAVVPASDVMASWCWGGSQFLLSKDVVQKVYDNKHLFRHSEIEDVALSWLVTHCGIDFTDGKACSINKQANGWLMLTYGGGEQKEFKDFSEIANCGEHFYRVKNDPDRSVDTYVMNELFKNLK